MYTVTWESEGGEQHKATNIPLIQMVVDGLEKLDDAERESVRVTDNNPQGDVTAYAFELLIERYAPTDEDHDKTNDTGNPNTL